MNVEMVILIRTLNYLMRYNLLSLCMFPIEMKDSCSLSIISLSTAFAMPPTLGEVPPQGAERVCLSGKNSLLHSTTQKIFQQKKLLHHCNSPAYFQYQPATRTLAPALMMRLA